MAVVGKYTSNGDAYKSISEALIHAGIPNDCRVEIDWIESDSLEAGKPAEISCAGWMLSWWRLASACAASKARSKRSVTHRDRLAVLRNLPWSANGGDRVLPKRMWARRRQQRGNVREPSIPGNPPVAGSSRGCGQGRDHAPRCLSMQRGNRIVGSQALSKYQDSERHRHRYEVNNDFREKLTEGEC